MWDNTYNTYNNNTYEATRRTQGINKQAELMQNSRINHRIIDMSIKRIKN